MEGDEGFGYGFGLEAHSEISWEARLGTIGRLLDQHGEAMTSFHITVLERGIVIQRTPPVRSEVETPAADQLVKEIDRMVGKHRPDPLQELDILWHVRPLPEEEPFVVKRVATQTVQPSTRLPAAVRQRLRAAMRAARLDPGGLGLVGLRPESPPAGFQQRPPEHPSI